MVRAVFACGLGDWAERWRVLGCGQMSEDLVVTGGGSGTPLDYKSVRVRGLDPIRLCWGPQNYSSVNTANMSVRGSVMYDGGMLLGFRGHPGWCPGC